MEIDLTILTDLLPVIVTLTIFSAVVKIVRDMTKAV